MQILVKLLDYRLNSTSTSALILNCTDWDSNQEKAFVRHPLA